MKNRLGAVGVDQDVGIYSNHAWDACAEVRWVEREVEREVDRGIKLGDEPSARAATCSASIACHWRGSVISMALPCTLAFCSLNAAGALAGLSANTRRNPSSTSARRVVRLCSASCLADLNSGSGSSIVFFIWAPIF